MLVSQILVSNRCQLVLRITKLDMSNIDCLQYWYNTCSKLLEKSYHCSSCVVPLLFPEGQSMEFILIYDL